MKMMATYNPDYTKTYSASAGILVTNHQGTIMYYNDAAADMWGRRPLIDDPAELPFCGSEKLYTPGGLPLSRSQCPMAHALRYNLSIRNEKICFEKPDGSRVEIVVNIDPIRGLNGIPTGAINVFYIAPQLVDNKTDREVETPAIEATFENSIDGIITKWSSEAARIFKYSDNEVLGRPIDMIIPHYRKPEELQLRNQLRRLEPVGRFETVRVAKDHRQMLASVEVKELKDEKGRVVGSIRKVRDVTRAVPVRQKLQEYDSHLSLFGKPKDKFLAVVCHELYTPLTSLSGYLQLIESECSEMTSKRYARKAIAQVGVLQGFISDILDLSAIETGNLKLQPSRFSLNELINTCVEEMQLHRKDVSFENRTDATDPVSVTADSNRIKHVLVHLLTNAIKYSATEKRVIIDTKADSDWVTVSVKDFGMGIAADKLPLIFNRVPRVSGPENYISGLGVGLYLCKQIISKHGGEIWAESEQAKGSTFYFRIPATGREI